jgi:hypothetical protein
VVLWRLLQVSGGESVRDQASTVGMWPKIWTTAAAVWAFDFLRVGPELIPTGCPRSHWPEASANVGTRSQDVAQPPLLNDRAGLALMATISCRILATVGSARGPLARCFNLLVRVLRR